jgi:peptidoglycan/LPS O-acetylase OafA/YrhL
MSRSISTILLVLGTIGRLTVFAGIAVAGYAWLAWDGDQYPDAENFWLIGPFMLLVLGGLAILWGATDGLRGLSLKALVIRWAVVGLATGLASAAGYQWSGATSLPDLVQELIAYGIGGSALIAMIAAGAATIAKMLIGPPLSNGRSQVWEAHQDGPR